MNLKLFLSLATMIALMVVICVPDALASAGSGGGMPYESWHQSLEDSVTGPVAFSNSGIAIVVCGLTLAFGGDLPGFFRQLVFLILGMAIILCAANIKSQFFGKGALIAHACETIWMVCHGPQNSSHSSLLHSSKPSARV